MTRRTKLIPGFLTKSEQKLIPVGEAGRLLGRVMRTVSVMHPCEPLLYRAVDISSQIRSGLYDCLYLARGAEGVRTGDRRS